MEDPAATPDQLAGPPGRAVPIPAVVTRLAGELAATPVWRNELGGLTFRVGAPPRTVYVKWQPVEPADGRLDDAVDLAAEADRLRWLSPHTPVPEVLDHGGDDEGSWLVTAGVEGTSAVEERWKAEPARAAAALGEALRRFHDEVPVAGCPFDWSVEERLARAGVTDFDAAPTNDRLVVCHGDACVPNTLLHDDGSLAAHVDVGRCGIADRWADLAVGSMSLGWNYGPGWEPPYFEAYGIEPDVERMDFYRRLWNAT